MTFSSATLKCNIHISKNIKLILDNKQFNHMKMLYELCWLKVLNLGGEGWSTGTEKLNKWLFPIYLDDKVLWRHNASQRGVLKLTEFLPKNTKITVLRPLSFQYNSNEYLKEVNLIRESIFWLRYFQLFGNNPLFGYGTFVHCTHLNLIVPKFKKYRKQWLWYIFDCTQMELMVTKMVQSAKVP